MTDTSELLGKVKQNLILEHTADDTLLERYIIAAVSYAESYQHLPEGYYGKNAMPATTEQAVIMLSSHFLKAATVPRADSLRITPMRQRRSGIP